MAEARAVRLIVEYDGDDVRLVSQQEVDVAVPAAGVSPLQPGALAVETRTEQDAAVDRVEVPLPDVGSAEVFPEDPAGRIERVDVDRPAGAFTVVVPVSDQARSIAVLRGSTPRAVVGEPSAETTSEGDVTVLATFGLDAADTGDAS
jgi:hypothetical protein